MKREDSLRGIESPTIDLKADVIGGIVLLLLAGLLPRLGVSNDVAWFAGIMAVLLPLVAASVKIHQASVSAKLARCVFDGPGQVVTLACRVSEFSGDRADYAHRVLRRATTEIESISKGIVSLTEAEYFDRIIDEIKTVPNKGTVLAVNAFEASRWINDPREMLYFDENASAVLRGARIKRIFIVDQDLFDSSSNQDARKAAIRMHCQARIDVKVVFRQSLFGKGDLMMDWVAFCGTEPRLYVDYQDPADPTRVARGDLYLNRDDYADFERRFRLLEEHARPSTEVDRWLDVAETTAPEKVPLGIG